MCSIGGGGIDLGIGKINFADTIKTVGLGLVGTAIYDAMIGDPQKAQEKALQAQQESNRIAVDSARRQADAADQAFNRANGKVPDVMGITDSNRMNAKGGQSGTMLTGTSGVDPTALLLGKKTLLGS